MNSWLFTKSDKSIYIVRQPPFSLVVRGPGPEQAQHAFENERDLQQYQVSVAERCAATGWILHSTDTQRRVRDRRAAARGTPDRRVAAR